MARLPRGETQHREGSARGRIEIDSSMLQASGNDGQSNRVDSVAPSTRSELCHCRSNLTKQSGRLKRHLIAHEVVAGTGDLV
jgi:hypothetical protein